MDDVITEYLEPDIMLPAVGQGAIGIECLESNVEACAVAALTEERDHRIAAEAERAFLRAVGGFCRTPLACYATVQNDRLSVEAMAATPDGTVVLRESITTDAATESGRDRQAAPGHALRPGRWGIHHPGRRADPGRRLGAIASGFAGQHIKLVRNVDQFSELNLPVTSGDPLLKSGAKHNCVLAESLPDKVDDVMEKIRYVFLIAATLRVHHPI